MSRNRADILYCSRDEGLQVVACLRIGLIHYIVIGIEGLHASDVDQRHSEAEGS
jgi:hypothetical protein